MLKAMCLSEQTAYMHMKQRIAHVTMEKMRTFAALTGDYNVIYSCDENGQNANISNLV
ncbi:MAG: hypothetical protein ACLVAT_05245 [Lachnospiraceae bacterium]